MVRNLAILLLLITTYSCKKETLPIIEDEHILNASWKKNINTLVRPYATPDGVVLKSTDGIRFLNRASGEIEWFVQQDNSLFPSHQHSFIYNDVFYSLQTGGIDFKGIDLKTGTEPFDFSKLGFGLDQFIRLSDNNKIRFSTSYLNALTVIDINPDGTGMDTVFSKSITGVDDVEGLDCYENETYYFVLFLANTTGITNYTVNFCAINKQTLNIERHIQGLASTYNGLVNYRFLDLEYGNNYQISAVVGSDVFAFNLNLPASIGQSKFLENTSNVATYDGIAYSHGFNNRNLFGFGSSGLIKINIPCAWGYTGATIAASKEHVFFPLRDATVAVYNLSTLEQHTFMMDFISSEGIHLSADTVHQIMYAASSGTVWAVPYGK
jgi:hypothetical protein